MTASHKARLKRLESGKCCCRVRKGEKEKKEVYAVLIDESNVSNQGRLSVEVLNNLEVTQQWQAVAT